MGGDHKCPVCQATFTRPQHVARHMRSHTGDRPYKCQFCGDQFARSDLLSRHVNKCHADEKPPPTSGGSRRKGIAASRATTSKQACDQCVQSSLPCDGGCPCTKCAHRNRECTFVKFHRQTAPVGPGHHSSVPSHPHPILPHTSATSPLYSPPTSTRYNIYPHTQPQDDLLLGPSPTQSMADNLYSPEMAFQTLYPQQGDGNPGGAPPIDQVMMQYKLSADQVRRNSIAVSGYDAPPPPEQAQRPSSAEEWMGWDQQQQYHDLSREKDSNHHQQYVTIPAVSRFQQQPLTPSSSASSSSHGHGGHSVPPSSFPSYMLPHRIVPSNSMHSHLPHQHNGQQQQQQPGRRGSNDESSGASAHTSATSSSVHLPTNDVNVNVNLPGPGSMSSYDVGGVNLYQAHAQQHHQQQSQNSNPNPNQPSQNQNPDHRYPTNDPAFSSAFGLMSLDDPAVLAGLASDAQPFFTPHDLGVKMEEPDPDATPLGHPAESSSTGGNAQPPGSDPGQGQRIKDEADSRAVRELWGQYISTPFSGPHSALEGHDTSKNMSTTGVQRNGSLNIHGHGTPSWLPYKRQRVNSLPSAGRTPVQARYPGQDKNQHHQNINPSTLRTVHNLEDLHSYEAAVMSRVPPTQLRLPNRKRSVDDKSLTGVESKSADTSPMVPARAYSVGGAASSALAHAFSFGVDMKPPFVSRGKNGGRDRDKQQQEQKQRVKLESHGPRSVSSSSRESSLGVEDRMSVGSRSRSGSGSGGEMLSMRPSFKRLPSQTLEPVTSKRALLVHHRDQEGEDGAADDGGGGGAGVGVGVGWGLQAKLHLGGSRSLADRRRRMSAPGGLSPAGPTFGGDVGAGHRLDSVGG